MYITCIFSKESCMRNPVIKGVRATIVAIHEAAIENFCIFGPGFDLSAILLLQMCTQSRRLHNESLIGKKKQ